MNPGDIRVELATTSAEVDRAIDLAESVWGARPINDAMLRALELAGCYVAVARDGGGGDVGGGDVVGMCAGFVGVHDDGLHLHSHLAAVRPDAQGRGIGRALKRHQRRWCLDHDIPIVSWTFDPLVRENARFNLHHLGAVGDRYLVDLYGPMDDDINRGQPSDRLLMRWDLRSDTAEAALAAPLPTLPARVWREQGAIEAVRDHDGRPVTDAPTDGSTSGFRADARLIATPADITGLRRRDPDLALAWRLAVRDAMVAAFADGLHPVALTDEHSYFCVRPTPEEP